MKIHTINEIQALDGRIFAMLTPEEIGVLGFFRTEGKKFDISVSIINEADPKELAMASSKEQADAIMKQANSRVSVIIGQDADSLYLFWQGMSLKPILFKRNLRNKQTQLLPVKGMNGETTWHTF